MGMLPTSPIKKIERLSSRVQQADLEKRKYKSLQTYADSKIANLYFTYELARKFKGDTDAPKVIAAHPGWTQTDLQRHSGFMRFLNTFFSQGTDMGALQTLRAAIDPDAESGDYFGPSKYFFRIYILQCYLFGL
jgi:NAD(P)-dependent dehydrogenase (short-subunit alcohol dehydrogenase family)